MTCWVVGAVPLARDSLCAWSTLFGSFIPVWGASNFLSFRLPSSSALRASTLEVVTLNRLFTHPEVRLKTHDTVEGVPVVRIGYFGSSRYPVAMRILSCIEQSDLVHVHGVDFFCDYLALTCSLHRKPLVLSTHGGFFHTNFGGVLKTVFFKTITRVSLRRYARVIACMWCQRRGAIPQNHVPAPGAH